MRPGLHSFWVDIGLIFSAKFCVIDGFVELGAGSHLVDVSGLGTGGEEVGVEFFDSLEHDSEGCDGEDDHLVAEVVELVGCDERGLAKFSHIGEEGDTGERFAELGEFRFGFESFGENGVGTDLNVGFGTVDGFFDAVGATSIGAGDDDETGVGFVIDGGADFRLH